MLIDPMNVISPLDKDNGDVQRAAKAMESYFLRALLKEVKAFATSGGAGASTFQDMFREALADAMAEGQGLGITDVMTANAKEMHPGPQVLRNRPNLADGGQ